MWQNDGVQILQHHKASFGQIQDGHHPHNKINMSPVPVLELDFVYGKVCKGEVSIR